MNIFQKGIKFLKDLFTEDDEEKVVSITQKATAKSPEKIIQAPKLPVKTADSMTFRVGEGLNKEVDVLPGPRRENSYLDAYKRGDVPNVTLEPQKPAISETAIAKQAVGKQNTPTLKESAKEIAGETGKGIVSFVGKKIQEDIDRSPIDRFINNITLPYRISKEVVKLIPMIPGFVVRQSLSAAQSITKPDEQIEIPESMRFAFGEEPIKSFQKRYEDSKQILTDLGANEEQARNLSVFGVALATWADLDLFPGKNKLKQEIAGELEKVVKDKATKDIIIKEAERIAALPKQQRQAAINTTISNLVDDGSDAFRFFKESKEIADFEYKYGNPVIYLPEKNVYAKVDDLTPEQKLKLVNELENVEYSKGDIVHINQPQVVQKSGAKEVGLNEIAELSPNAKNTISKIVDFKDMPSDPITADIAKAKAREESFEEWAGKQMNAYHGTPHKFEEFSMSKIGTGEGAQAYGKGLYFAENKSVAEWYQKMLAGETLVNGKTLKWVDSSSSVNKYNQEITEKILEFSDGSKIIIDETKYPNGAKYIERAFKTGSPGQTLDRLAQQRMKLSSSDDVFDKAAAKELDEIFNQLKFEEKVGGSLMDVSLNVDKNKLLDWDKKISEQIEIKKLLGNDYNKYKDLTGKQLYTKLGDNANEYLVSKGIYGNKYLDGASRKAGSGNYNYVVFDDTKIKTKSQLKQLWDEAADDLTSTIQKAKAEGKSFEEWYRKEAFSPDSKFEYHLSDNPNLVEGKTFAEQIKPDNIGERGFGGREENIGQIFTTKAPQQWSAQLNYEGNKKPFYVYLVEAKTPGKVDIMEGLPHQSINPPADVKILKKIGGQEVIDNPSLAEQAKQSQLKKLWDSVSAKNIAIKPTNITSKGTRIGSIGLDKFDLKGPEKEALVDLFKKSGIEEKTPQTEKEWIELAKKSEVMQKTMTREEVTEWNAQLIKTEQRVKSLNKELMSASTAEQRGQIMREAFQSTRVLNDDLYARGAGLRAAKTLAGEEETILDVMLKDIAKNTDDIEAVVRRAGSVDFNDQKQVQEFYREFVKPKLSDIFTEYRYNNMLSNPRTQARNLMSNTLQALLVRPATKFLEAGIDTFTSALTGKQKESFLRDVPKYYWGLAKSIPEAFSEFMATMRGERAFAQQDLKKALQQVPTGKMPGFMRLPSMTLESVDRMLQTLVIGGETAAGKSLKEAQKIAEYSMFRAGLDTGNKTGQGILLSGIDNVIAKVEFLRQIPGGTWFIPFLRTPMNFAKQWIEYSPVGLFTLPGSTRKKEQLAKALIGSAITGYAAAQAWEGKTSWAPPKDEEARALFYASGKKPFSVMINDKWVPMMYLGPWAFAFALPAALKYHAEDDPQALTDSTLDKLGKDLSALVYFYSQQTFVEGIGNMVDLLSGDPDTSFEKNMAFTAGQVIPFQGLVRYVSTIIDPVYRKSSSFLEAIESGIPYMSRDLEPYTTPTGEMSTRNKWSYLAPYDISDAKQEYDEMLKVRNQELQSNALRNEMDKKRQKQAVQIVDMLYNGKTDEEIIEAITPMKDDPALKTMVKSLIKKQANYMAGTVQPYMILEPKDRAELIHTKTIMAVNGGKKEEEELIDLLQDLKEANMWGEKERAAFKSLMEEYPPDTVKK